MNKFQAASSMTKVVRTKQELDKLAKKGKITDLQYRTAVTELRGMALGEPVTLTPTYNRGLDKDLNASAYGLRAVVAYDPEIGKRFAEQLA